MALEPSNQLPTGCGVSTLIMLLRIQFSTTEWSVAECKLKFVGSPSPILALKKKSNNYIHTTSQNAYFSLMREVGKEEKNHSQSFGRSRERIKHSGWSKGCSKHPMSNYNNMTTPKKPR